MYCKYCGQELKEDVVYCPHCGAKVEKEGEIMDTPKVAEVENTNPEIKKSGYAIASLVLGIVGAVFSSLVCGLLAVIFSSMANTAIKNETRSGKGMRVAGLVLGIIAMVGSVFSIVKDIYNLSVWLF